MSKPTTDPKRPGKQAERAARDKRLADRLRENLRRRKEAALAARKS